MKTDGILVALEGIDGSGKSTLAKNLNTLLHKHGIQTILTREPGATDIGKQIRSWLHNNHTPLNPKAEFLLFAADRAQHIEETILPNLAKRSIIISDRFADSSLVYQGYGRGISRTNIQNINKWIMCSVRPHLTIYLRISHIISQKRLHQRQNLNDFDKQDAVFTEKLITGFEKIYKDRKDVIILDASESIEIVTQHAYHAIATLIHTTWNIKI